MLLGLVGLTACAGAPRTHRDPTPVQAPSVMAQDPEAEPMLDRVEGDDTTYIELPDAGACPHPADEVPTFAPIDDAHVPAVDRQRERLTNMDSGDESLTDTMLLVHLDTATDQVLDCVRVAACYDQGAAGEIEFAFEVDPAGKVRAVDVTPSETLDRWGVAACARAAIYSTEFPAYNGADIFVTYRLEID